MFITDEQYRHATQQLAGQLAPSPLFREFSAWCAESCGLKIYDFFCEDFENGRVKLVVLLWDFDAMCAVQDEYMNYDEAKQAQIAEGFAGLCRKHAVLPQYQQPQRIFVCFDTLEDGIRTQTLHELQPEVLALEALPEVWKIYFWGGGVYCFLHTDEDLERSKTDGTRDKINAALAQIVKKHDVFHAFGDKIGCSFSSRQTLDEKYGGSFRNYID